MKRKLHMIVQGRNLEVLTRSLDALSKEGYEVVSSHCVGGLGHPVHFYTLARTIEDKFLDPM